MKSSQPRQTSAEKKKLSTLSAYYNREFKQKRSQFEEMQIFRWLQLIQIHYAIFNVRNYHDCIRADREEKAHARLHDCQAKPVIVQPFQSITNFYGCIQCGKYHICALKRDTCPLIIDRADKQKVCAYSGKMLLIQDNLEATFEDSKHADKESTYLFPMGSKRRNSSPKKLRNSPNSKKKSKKPQRIRIQDLFNQEDAKEKQQQQAEPSTSSVSDASRPKKKLRISDEWRESVKQAYDLSLESLSETDDEEDGRSDANNTSLTECVIREDDYLAAEETEEDRQEREKRPLKRKRAATLDEYDEEEEAEESEDQMVEEYHLSQEAEDGESYEMMVEEETGDTEFHKEDREWLLGNEREYINNEESVGSGFRNQQFCSLTRRVPILKQWTQILYSLRGLASNVDAIFMDEFLFMNIAAYPAMLPSSATGGMLIMISSMSGNANSPAMKLIDATYDDGTPVVKKINWVQACIICKRKGVAEKCTHMPRTPQHFQSVASMARLSKLLGATNPDAYKIEMEYVV
jgi:hypothetical protein